MTERSPRRIVVWADGSAQAPAWAAHHAVARALPLHVLHFPGIVASADALAGSSARGAGFAATDSGAVDVVEAAHVVRRIRARHAQLTVTVQMVHDGRALPDRRLVGPGDVLVTGPKGYLDLADLRASEGRAASTDADAARVPVVIVPERRASRSRDARRILLLIGERLSPAAASFAFAAAADLGLPLDAVHVAPDDGAFGDDYWIDPTGSTFVSEPRLRDELAALHTRHPDVRMTFSTLRTEPWMTLRAMAQAADLAVLTDGSDCAADLRALLEFGACPIAVIRED